MAFFLIGAEMNDDNYWMDTTQSLNHKLGGKMRPRSVGSAGEGVGQKPVERYQGETHSISLPPELLQKQPQVRELTDDEVDERAFYDNSSGVYNFRYMLRLLTAEFIRATTFERPYSLLVLSVDDYLKIAVAYGHLALDLVRCTVASQLLANCSAAYSVGSYCEGKFLIVVPEASLAHASALAAHLIQKCRVDLQYQWTQIKVSISVGIACGSPEIDIESLIAIADLGAEIANSKGGSDYSFAPNEPISE
jgi:diguanylate cyclase (GGDEF)-like protein